MFAGSQIDAHDGRGLRGRRADEDGRAAGHPQATIGRKDELIGEIERRGAAGVHVQAIQVHLAAIDVGAQQAAGRFIGIGSQPKHPMGHAEIGRQRVERCRRAAPIPGRQPVEVPPAAAVRDKRQAAVGRPCGLEDSLGRAAGDAPRINQ